MYSFLRLAIGAIWIVTPAALAGESHHHESDFIIGVSNGPSPRLKFDFDQHVLSGEEYVELHPSVNPAVAGWLGDAPGFKASEVDHPDEDFFRLAAGAEIRLVGVDLDAALFVRGTSLGTPVRISPSPILGFLSLGGRDLHTHGIWHIDSSAAGFDPQQAAWSGTFKFTDAGTTGYADSEPFTIRFAAVPEPFSAALIVLGSVLAGSTRRRR